MDPLQREVEGMMDDEDRMVAEMLGELEEKKPAPPPMKVEVITPSKPTKLLVSIPPDNPNAATVTRVEVMEDGNFRILEHARPPTEQERALIMHGKREVLSAPAASVSAAEEPKKEGRPWWQWAIVAAVAGGGALWAANKYLPKKNEGLEAALEGEEEAEEGPEEGLEEEVEEEV